METIVFLRFVGPEAYFILRVLLKMNKNTIVENVTEMHDLVKKLLGLLCQCLGGYCVMPSLSVSWGYCVRHKPLN